MEFHPIADIFPLMAGASFDEFCQDIKANGLREPIVIHQEKIIDGRNRFRACQQVGIEPRFREWDGEGDLVKYILSLNLHRRHLDTSQRAMVAARIANMKSGERTDLASLEVRSISIPEAAKMMNVGGATVSRAKEVIRTGSEELVKAVDEGVITARTAHQIARLPEPEQKEAIEEAKTKKRKPSNAKEKTKKKKRYSFLDDCAKHNTLDPKENIVSPEFERVFKMMENAICEAKGSKWETTSKEAVLAKLAILAFIAQN